MSALICSGQMTRDEALVELEDKTYSMQHLQQDKSYILAKLGISEERFQEMMTQPIRSHSEFATHKNQLRLLRLLRPIRGAFS